MKCDKCNGKGYIEEGAEREPPACDCEEFHTAVPGGVAPDADGSLSNVEAGFAIKQLLKHHGPITVRCVNGCQWYIRTTDHLKEFLNIHKTPESPL